MKRVPFFFVFFFTFP
ncbi:pheA operon leader peptide PheL [Klebsiella variicola subsp. variicola]|nr:pheA operon leader peptide PheL [Klebsiella variicola subsp. variicola]